LRPRVRTSLGLLLAACLAGHGCAKPKGVEGAPVDPVACLSAGSVRDVVFLIGDAGAPKLGPEGDPEIVDPVLGALQADVAAAVAQVGADRVWTIFLGDNVYQKGLVPEGHADRRHGERVLEAQVAAAAPGRAVFTLGNHDWDMDGPRGWQHALEQRRFLERFAPRVESLPPGGCAGPYHLDVGDHLRFVFIDIAGFDHMTANPEEHARECRKTRDGLEAFFDLSAELRQNEGRHVALAMHHPLITAGPHGGNFTWKQHIFPLTDFWDWAWLPLPIIGSLYPLSRRMGVTITDTTNPLYEQAIFQVYRASSPFSPLFFVGGHEHSLQVHRDILGVYYLVSGAGSTKKVNRVENLDTVMMAEALPGYMRLNVHDNGALGLTVLAADDPAIDLFPMSNLIGGSEPPQSEPIFGHCLADGPYREWRRTRDREAGATR
jgi:hypothetical protein